MGLQLGFGLGGGVRLGPLRLVVEARNGLLIDRLQMSGLASLNLLVRW